jgi:2-octaprenyl-6-methoxyphenol hydroxylase
VSVTGPDCCDVAIAGGGPVGAACALALAARGFSVRWLAPREAATGADQRPLALSQASVQLLQRLGAQAGVAQATPIAAVHVSQRGGFGRLVMTARDAGVPALGCVGAYRDVHHALLAAAERGAVPRVLSAVAAATLAPAADAVAVQCADGGTVGAKLLVCADGGAGLLAQRQTVERDYRASALTATIQANEPHGGRAFERFTADGPIALLPRGEGYALVWTLPAASAAALAEAPAADFLAALQSAFGQAAGAFTAVSERALHALKLRALRQVTAPRIVAIGNAAQTLHPVAGQGLNLGLRDAWELAQVLADHAHDPGAADALAAYAAKRRFDRWATIGLTDGLARVFLPDQDWARGLRGMGLAALGSLPPLRRAFARRMIFGARA